MDKLTTRCRHCQKKIVFDGRHSGRTVKCPSCQQFVLLASAVRVTDSVIDPFADLAKEGEESDPSARTNAPQTSKNTSKRTREVQRRPLASSEPVSSPSRGAAAPESEGAQPVEELLPLDESYIDEFGLADLDLNEAETQSQPAMPPVSRDFIRKKPRSANSGEAIGRSRSEKSANTSERRKVVATQFRSDNSSAKRGRRKVYLILLLALLPLMLNTLARHRNPGKQGELNADADVQPENVQEQRLFDEAGEHAADDRWGDGQVQADPEVIVDDMEDVFDQLPGHRTSTAFLSRDSKVHWIFAGLSGAGFFTVVTLLFRRFDSPVGFAAFATVFTAIVGMILLICLQGVAYSTSGFWLIGRSFLVLIFLIFKFIGFSYRCGMEAEHGFMLSFVAFTCGVGLCVEICKLLPVIRYLTRTDKASWHGACLVGLASGVGFGITQGIIYSSQYHNGIATGDVYLVRFVSCVALHAVWSGAGAALLYFNQDGMHGGFSVTDFASTLLMTQGTSLIMHGLCDTLIKKDHSLFALLIGVASVGWLIYLLERLARDEDLSTA